jgi:transposase
MYLHYADLIRESAEELARLERAYRGSPVADRLQMLRLLKAGTSRSRRTLSSLLGYSERQLQRWFDTYRKGGLGALLVYERPSGASERITAEAWAALEGEMKVGRVARLRDAQRLLEERFGIAYSIGGLSDLFQRHKTKLKTGRRRNRRASTHEQEAFKKTVPS